MRLAILGAITAFIAAAPLAAQPTPTFAPGETLLNVEAVGTARSRPDVMTISAGTVTTGATAAEAVAANNALATRLTAAVRAAGVEPRDVRTSNFSVEPQFEGNRESGRLTPDGRPPRIVGYVVRNGFEVRLRDLSKAEDIISRLFEAGANAVGGPTFSLSDDTAARREAERSAIAEARAKAENYAAAMGRHIDRVLRVGESNAWTEPRRYRQIAVSGSRIQPTPVEPGEIETHATIYVDYVLAPQ